MGLVHSNSSSIAEDSNQVQVIDTGDSTSDSTLVVAPHHVAFFPLSRRTLHTSLSSHPTYTHARTQVSGSAPGDITYGAVTQVRRLHKERERDKTADEIPYAWHDNPPSVVSSATKARLSLSVPFVCCPQNVTTSFTGTEAL